MSENALKTRPPLCPCKNTCTPIRNELEFDKRLKTGDLNEGYSGACIGKSSVPLEYEVGGNKHTNDMNHCVFTPLKGVVRFQINENDVKCMLHMARGVLAELHPDRKCEECGACHAFTHFVIIDDHRYCCHCAYGKRLQGTTEAT